MFTPKLWFKLSLLNLFFVALYGALMRYKIAFDFPLLEQKNLLHAHSHFAFAGWISHFIYTGLTLFLQTYLSQEKLKKYQLLIALNLICAFGMLLAFTIQGYKVVSISFSTITIFIAIIYTYFFVNDTKKLSHPSIRLAYAGLAANIFSSAGPFMLAYMVASKNIDHELYLGSVYYYLHFQYSGWFFFGFLAIAAAKIPDFFKENRKLANLLIATCIPTFLLSILWAKLPLWLYIIAIAATVIQMFAWWQLFMKIWKETRTRKVNFAAWIKIFFIVSTLALTLKFILQTVSVIPSLSQLVFGIRPIVIAYLHLVLLGVYSLFIIGYLFANKWINGNSPAKFAAFVFLFGVLLNELLLAVQGFAAFAYIPIPKINEMLLAAAVILASSALLLAFSQSKTVSFKR